MNLINAAKQSPKLDKSGQIAWSSKGPDNRTTSGRSEQVNETLGIASTYACYNECMDSYGSGWVEPDWESIFPENSILLTAYQVDINSYQQPMPPYPVFSANWESGNPSAVSVNPSGEAYGVSGGVATITASWWADLPTGGETCQYYSALIEKEAFVSVTPVCAYPVNFQQNGDGQDVGDGTLRFQYSWQSSTGNLSDLSQCQLGEIVTYPGTGNYIPPIPPFPNEGFPNPTIIEGSIGVNGGFLDNHSIASPFTTPYQTASFTAVQYYRYKCPCMNNGDYVNLMGPLNIVRSVSPSTDEQWKYTITKSGASAAINPLP